MRFVVSREVVQKSMRRLKGMMFLMTEDLIMRAWSWFSSVIVLQFSSWERICL